MPIISVKMSRGRSLETKQELVQAITRDAAAILKVEPEWITVLIEEYERENWATAGELHAIKYGSGFGSQGVNKK